MSQPTFIGICGRARSGKDTFGWFLVDALRKRGVDARRYGFADALKAVCRVEYGMVGKDARLLQEVGVDYRNGTRAFNRGYNAGLATLSDLGYEVPTRLNPVTPNVWLDAALAAVAEDAPEVAVFCDVRFPNEAAVMHKLYRVVRTNRDPSGRDDAHISETALDDYPATIVSNEKSLFELKDLAYQVAGSIFKELNDE